MVRDLTTNVLPAKTKDEIEQLLGKSPVRGEWGRSGSDYYLKHLEWDLVYPLGRDQTSDEDSPDTDYLTIRLDTAGRFASWYIKGDQIWPKVAGKKANATYRKISAKGESSRSERQQSSNNGTGTELRGALHRANLRAQPEV